MKAIFFSVILGLFIQAQCSCVGTLYANDPFAYGLYFYDGSACQSEQGYWTYNYHSDLVYNHYYAGQMTIAPEGSRIGAVSDLGDVNSIYNSYGCSGANSIYSSIHYDEFGNLVVQQNGYDTFQSLYLNETDASATNSFIPVVGHVYIINITDSYDYGFSRVVKMILLDVTGNYATLRWDVLSDSENYGQGPCFVQSYATMNTVIQGNSNSYPQYDSNSYSSSFSEWTPNAVVMFTLIGVVGCLALGFCCLTTFVCIRACGKRRRHHHKAEAQAQTQVPQPPQYPYQYVAIPSQQLSASQPLLATPPNYNSIQQQN